MSKIKTVRDVVEAMGEFIATHRELMEIMKRIPERYEAIVDELSMRHDLMNRAVSDRLAPPPEAPRVFPKATEAHEAVFVENGVEVQTIEQEERKEDIAVEVDEVDIKLDDL